MELGYESGFFSASEDVSMLPPVPESNGLPAPITLTAVLPGPDRKRAHSPYVYRMQYANTALEGSGCVMTWEVQGGRLSYQIAVERAEDGRLRCHCTCADAVYRAEGEGRCCKHVLGFLTWGQGSNAGCELGRAG
jgi:hypothetical protein